MYVCICKGIKEKELLKYFDKIKNIHGYIDMDLIQHYTSATTNCGCCYEDITLLLNKFENTHEKQKILAKN